jgi:sugar/nucleoside kinase (ribokinase family)
MVGVGGIGSGQFFALRGNRTLGREESRGGRFLDRRDYCKLHIISHYVKALLGPEFAVLPVGKVGADESGRRLREEMEGAGLDLRHVETVEGVPTLFSFCFVYPDGSGGNLTTDDSASSRVTPGFVDKAAGSMEEYRGAGIALAVPEVPLEARVRLLEHGTRCGFLRAASFSSSEIGYLMDSGLGGVIDLLALNIDEAKRVIEEQCQSASTVVEKAAAALSGSYPRLNISITAGSGGSWAWDGSTISFFQAPKVEVVSTAGSGDAFLAGLLAGFTAGLALAEAQGLATLVASLSATSPHTIHKGIDRESLSAFARETKLPLPERVREILLTGK